MQALLAVPYFHQPRGNKVTAERIAQGLNQHGIYTEIVSSTEETSVTDLPESDIYHGFHAYRFYNFMKRTGRVMKPYIITITGTDLNKDLYDPERRADVIEVLRGAEAVHVFDEKAMDKLLTEVPDLQEKTIVIPQSVARFPKSDPPLMKEAGTFLFILPAGIREVKNIPEAIRMLKKLRTKYPEIRLWLAGPVIEREEGDKVRQLMKENDDWLTYLGEIEYEKMGALYAQGDVVLNTSLAEGQSSALLEAMLVGLPVLASNIAGNRSIISHEKTGMLYEDEEAFLSYAEKMLTDTNFRLELSESGKKYVKEFHSPEEEAEKLAAVYKNCKNAKDNKEEGTR
ncbi:glycosyltransferase family 4 protein [Evansella sp. LMS18]|uniref:glycosyltransferase n=1 Tax=Evansella sp. LMS18 TaxID=2924033 RepID=UPI0020D0784E|nr:glycosyltransferase [Evansella sp. LMS18]UTR10516.1 glycosyltransferase family 4 protein [Evansella sp. LMS18]